MTHAQSDTGSDGVANRPPAASTIERELAVEQAHVDLVYARLAEATRSAQQVARAGRSLYQSDRTSFVREEDGTGLYERDVFAFQAARRLAVLAAEQEGLVFGRLDRTDGEIRYVGRIGVRDAEYEPLVIDWRAPAAEPFYRATPSNPMQVIRRRVLHCRGDRVVGIEDDLLDGESADGALPVIGEGSLLAALSRARDHTMRDIVATIQAEQDEAIRAPYQGFTMISGGPGTGKTVVALHRAAYLLYSNRRRFESGGVLVVGPSRVFMNYIARVLPSLGEDSVTLRPIGAVASDVVRITGDRADDPATAAIKGSLRMVRLLRRLLHEPPQEVPLELRITVQGDVLVVSADTLARIRSQVLAHHKLNTGREAVAKELLSALWRNSRWAEEVDPADDDHERAEFYERVSDLATFKMFLNAWWPTLSAPEALARLADVELLRRISRSILSDEECELLSASYRDAPDWTAADGALLDELVQLLGPVPVAEEQVLSGLPDLDSEIPEVFTTADLLSPAAPQADPFEPGPRDLCAPAHRRGARCQPHAMADAAPARRKRQLDHCRRSCPELLDRQQRSRSRDRGDHRDSPGTALPDEHELSQPVGGLRPGRQGRRRRLPRCRSACGGALHRPPASALGADGRGNRGSDDSGGHDQHRALATRRGGRDGWCDLSPGHQS